MEKKQQTKSKEIHWSALKSIWTIPFPNKKPHHLKEIHTPRDSKTTASLPGPSKQKKYTAPGMEGFLR